MPQTTSAEVQGASVQHGIAQFKLDSNVAAFNKTRVLRVTAFVLEKLFSVYFILTK